MSQLEEMPYTNSLTFDLPDLQNVLYKRWETCSLQILNSYQWQEDDLPKAVSWFKSVLLKVITQSSDKWPPGERKWGL